MARLGLPEWAEAAYAAPGAAELCLQLQDAHGQSVCLLLWAAWAGQSGAAPDVAGAVALARAWEDGVVGPLRAARRGLKSAPGLAETDRAALRAQVAADELATERALLGLLGALEPRGAAATGPLEVLTAASVAWGEPAPAAMLAALAAAFPRG